MAISHPLRSIVIDFLPGGESIGLYPVERELVERVTAHALNCPMLFDEEAAPLDGGFALDDEFARRLGVSILNVLALSNPELKAMLTTTNAPIPRAPG